MHLHSSYNLNASGTTSLFSTKTVLRLFPCAKSTSTTPVIIFFRTAHTWWILLMRKRTEPNRRTITSLMISSDVRHLVSGCTTFTREPPGTRRDRMQSIAFQLSSIGHLLRHRRPYLYWRPCAVLALSLRLALVIYATSSQEST